MSHAAILLQHHRVGWVTSVCLLTMTGAMCHVHVCSVDIVPRSVCMHEGEEIDFVCGTVAQLYAIQIRTVRNPTL